MRQYCPIVIWHSFSLLQLDVETAAANVLDLFALIDPSKMTCKLKLHLLVHLKADILRFGPLVGVITETFESFNAIFRFCSVYSNHLAPSRDIAFQLASQEILKCRLSGGWWPASNGEWERSGPSVRNFIRDHPTLQALIGWTNEEKLVNGRLQFSLFRLDCLAWLGTFKLEPLKRDANRKVENRVYVPWCQTQGAKALNSSEDNDMQWTACRSVIASCGDRCLVGTWIFATSPFNASYS